LAAIAAIAIVANSAHAGAADQASAWDGDWRSAMRLVSARSSGEKNSLFLRAGAEIRLAPGWKTYWRYPGDSGVPPHFDFAGSDNVKSATVLWPAPQKFTDTDGATIGYKDRVLFPIHVTPQDPSKPVTLRLALDYAICEKLCIPVHAKAAIAPGKDATASDADVAAAEARVPKRIAAGASGSALAIKSVRREDASPPRVIVEVSAPAGKPVTLFAEGPTPNWALPLPDPVPGTTAGLQRFSFALDGLPGGAPTKNVTLTLTAIAGDRAIETPVHLD
jgi:DsbC/DsbD-like thiol-disulfide interchange protein